MLKLRHVQQIKNYGVFLEADYARAYLGTLAWRHSPCRITYLSGSGRDTARIPC